MNKSSPVIARSKATKQSWVVGFLFLCVMSFPSFSSGAASTPFSGDEQTQRIIRRNQIQDEARALDKMGRYDEAVAKYREAINPINLNYSYEAASGHGWIKRAYEKKGDYELALKELQWFIDSNPNEEDWLDDKLRLEALNQSRDTHSPQPIYRHIEYLKKRYEKQLPPNAGSGSSTVASTILRLYDHIGDYDTGIAFAESFMDRCAQGISCKGEEIKLAYTPKHPYYSIKQSFLQDKAEGKRGRATKTLIESDYFPW